RFSRDWSSDVCSSDLMDELVGDHVAIPRHLVPVDESGRLVVVLARTVVLEPDSAEPVGQRQQEVVVIERARAEQLERFVDQLLRSEERRVGDRYTTAE